MYKLLIVDDEDEIREGLIQYIPWKNYGFEVVGEAQNGIEALEKIKVNGADVVMCDIRMPQMSGLELARELYTSGSGITVVILSGYKDFEYAREAMQYNVKYYIIKSSKKSEFAEIFGRIKKNLDINLAAGITPDNTVIMDHNERILHTLKAYVAKNYTNVSLESAAELVHMNPHYLSRYFKQHTGGNFSDYVNTIRMNKASELLRDPNANVAEVGIAVGYSSTKNFSDTFKRHMGVTPWAFRSGRKKASE